MCGWEVRLGDNWDWDDLLKHTVHGWMEIRKTCRKIFFGKKTRISCTTGKWNESSLLVCSSFPLFVSPSVKDVFTNKKMSGVVEIERIPKPIGSRNLLNEVLLADMNAFEVFLRGNAKKNQALDLLPGGCGIFC